MKRFAAVVLGFLLVSVLPLASLAQGDASREAEMATSMRTILAATKKPQQVAKMLGQEGARFIGLQETNVTFVFTGQTVVPERTTVRTVGSDMVETISIQAPDSGGAVSILAGEKSDLTLSLWLYEWRNRDGTYTQQSVISGSWSDTEYSWIDDPQDVIDVRWTVGDLVYRSSTPYDGVQRDQHTQGIASYTVRDQVKSWDLFVNFKPVSSNVYGKWTNIFANYTHTWWGVKLSIALGAAPSGSTGTITINTDGKTWTKGTGLAFQIGSEDSRGAASIGRVQVQGRPTSPRSDWEWASFR